MLFRSSLFCGLKLLGLSIKKNSSSKYSPAILIVDIELKFKDYLLDIKENLIFINILTIIFIRIISFNIFLSILEVL